MSGSTSAPEALQAPAVMVGVIEEAAAPPQTQVEPSTDITEQPVQPPSPPEPPPPEPPPVQDAPAPEVQPMPAVTAPPIPAPATPPTPARPAKPRAAPRSAAPRTAPQAAPSRPDSATNASEQNSQINQAPSPAEPVMTSNVAFDGARPMPVYPQASRDRREEGRVVVLVRISAQGLVEQASVDVSSGYERLDAAALAAARQARFKPLVRNGVALAALAKLPFDFKMRK